MQCRCHGVLHCALGLYCYISVKALSNHEQEAGCIYVNNEGPWNAICTLAVTVPRDQLRLYWAFCLMLLVIIKVHTHAPYGDIVPVYLVQEKKKFQA